MPAQLARHCPPRPRYDAPRRALLARARGASPQPARCGAGGQPPTCARARRAARRRRLARRQGHGCAELRRLLRPAPGAEEEQAGCKAKGRNMAGTAGSPASERHQVGKAAGVTAPPLPPQVLAQSQRLTLPTIRRTARGDGTAPRADLRDAKHGRRPGNGRRAVQSLGVISVTPPVLDAGVVARFMHLKFPVFAELLGQRCEPPGPGAEAPIPRRARL